jgi:polyisoprenoid-binding protein YceI
VQGITEDRDADIVVYGSSPRSRDAATAAEKLERAGYRRLAVLQGGIESWRASGRPLEGSRPEVASDPLTRVRLEAGTFTLDLSQSTVGWTGRNRNSSHTGALRFKSGRLVVTDIGFTGSLTVDMASMENHNLAGDPLQPVLLAHLKSDDFFLVDHFPEAIFTISEARLREESCPTAANCDVVGELLLRGVTRSISFPATVTTSAGAVWLEAHFDLDRTAWGIIYGSSRFFEHLGMHQVFEAISIALRLVLTRG